MQIALYNHYGAIHIECTASHTGGIASGLYRGFVDSPDAHRSARLAPLPRADFVPLLSVFRAARDTVTVEDRFPYNWPDVLISTLAAREIKPLADL